MTASPRIEIDPVSDDSDTAVLRVDRTIASSPEYYSTPEEAESSPLGRAILEIGGLEAVLIQDAAITLQLIGTYVPGIVRAHRPHHAVDLLIGHRGRKYVPCTHLCLGFGTHVMRHAIQLTTHLIALSVVHHGMLVRSISRSVGLLVAG